MLPWETLCLRAAHLPSAASLVLKELHGKEREHWPQKTKTNKKTHIFPLHEALKLQPTPSVARWSVARTSDTHDPDGETLRQQPLTTRRQRSRRQIQQMEHKVKKVTTGLFFLAYHRTWFVTHTQGYISHSAAALRADQCVWGSVMNSLPAGSVMALFSNETQPPEKITTLLRPPALGRAWPRSSSRVVAAVRRKRCNI